VESGEDLAFLKEHDCDEAQGYYFSRPLPADQFAALLKDQAVYGDPTMNWPVSIF
jgi:EAL domain-containing protein (putative c-di-GMP-specific phosphodiesterase class I)